MGKKNKKAKNSGFPIVLDPEASCMNTELFEKLHALIKKAGIPVIVVPHENNIIKENLK